MDRNTRGRFFNNRRQSYFRRPIDRRQRPATQVSSQTREGRYSNYGYDRYDQNTIQASQEETTTYNQNEWNRPPNVIEFTRDGSVARDGLVVQNNDNRNNSTTRRRGRLIENIRSTRARNQQVLDTSVTMDKLDLKIETFISIVQTQSGDVGEIILIGKESDNSLGILQNSIDRTNISLSFVQMGNSHSLRFNNKTFLEGSFPSKQVAKSTLAEQAVAKLREECFFIIKKEKFEEINSDNLPSTSSASSSSENPSTPMEGGKAHQMMLKMGWAPGKGLGANEQGGQKTVAEMVENISRATLGNKSSNILMEINNVLRDFAYSSKLSILAFDPTFTKEERAQIHKLAQKFNLKSKSVGRNDNRRITVSKKLNGFDLVKCLLRQGLESEAYKLIIPSKYLKIWESDYI